MLSNSQRNFCCPASSRALPLHLLFTLPAPRCTAEFAIFFRNTFVTFVAKIKQTGACGILFFLPTLGSPSRMKKHFIAKQCWGTSPGQPIPQARPVLVRTMAYYLLRDIPLALTTKRPRAFHCVRDTEPRSGRNGFTPFELFVSEPPWRG